RQIAYDRIVMLHRRHVRAAQRSLTREFPLPEDSSLDLAQQLMARESAPGKSLDRQQLAERVRHAVARLSETGREVLRMRTFEGLSFDEVAYVVKIDAATARKRHGRALLRLHKALTEDGLTESQL